MFQGFWLQDYRDPEASAGSLLGGAEFWGLWMQAPWGSRFNSSPLVPRSIPGVPGLVPAPWGMELDLMVSGYRAWGFPEMFWLLVSGLVPDGWLQGPAKLKLVSACQPTVGGVRPSGTS